MRWIFLTLLLLNGALAVWGWQRPPESSDGASVRAVSGVNSAVAGEDGVSLMLLAEAGRQPEVAPGPVLEPLQYAELENDVSPSRPVCTLVGPFAEVYKGEQLIQRMLALEIRGEMRELEMPGEKGFWVYLTPEISKKEALRRLHELQAKGIDSFVIPGGELSNGISFGMFNQLEFANDAIQNLSNLGYEAKIKELERNYQEHWVVLNPQEAQKVSAELWFQLLDGLPNLQHRQNFCPGVASS